MSLHPIRAAEHHVAEFSRRVAFGSVAALALVVGLGFLTVAAWLVLSAQNGAIFAAGVIGATYLGFGLILSAFAASHQLPSQSDPPEDPYGPFVQMAEGFAAGLKAGHSTRNGRDG